MPIQSNYINIYKSITLKFWHSYCNTYYTKQTKNKKNKIMENITFNLSELGSADLESLSLVIKAYKENAIKEEILETGFNLNSGYVYIALENGITISSCFGQDVEYITTDFETGEENFYYNYFDALETI
jgi:hypothetical protein